MSLIKNHVVIFLTLEMNAVKCNSKTRRISLDLTLGVNAVAFNSKPRVGTRELACASERIPSSQSWILFFFYCRAGDNVRVPDAIQRDWRAADGKMPRNFVVFTAQHIM